MAAHRRRIHRPASGASHLCPGSNFWPRSGKHASPLGPLYEFAACLAAAVVPAQFGATCIHHACRGGHLAAVELLVSLGVNPLAKNGVSDAPGLTHRALGDRWSAACDGIVRVLRLHMRPGFPSPVCSACGSSSAAITSSAITSASCGYCFDVHVTGTPDLPSLRLRRRAYGRCGVACSNRGGSRSRRQGEHYATVASFRQHWTGRDTCLTATA